MTFLASHSATQLLLPAPVFWYFSLSLSFLVFPTALLAFVDQVFGPGYKKFIRRLWQFHLVFGVFAILLEILQIVPIPFWMDYLQYLWITDVLVVLITCITSAVKGNIEAKLFTAGIGFFSVTTLYDITVKKNNMALMQWGTLIFILFLSYLLFRRFTENSKRLLTYSKELEEAKKQLEEYSSTLEEKVAERTREVQEKQTQLIQSSKMASLGSLVAGVAHEINTPVGAINSMHNTLMRSFKNLKSELEECETETQEEFKKIKRSMNIIEDANKVIQSGTDRVIDIVKRLRSFARLDEAELKEADINEGLEDTLTIIHHELKHNIKVIKNYGDIPKISCFPGHLNQVFLNILINAKQAIKGKGEISIATYEKDRKVYIEIKDSGEGIPEKNLKKIFDPGYTTKGVGVGTGLGLSICYQIIEDHHGEIRVESELGTGSIFIIELPMDLEKIIRD
jgi:signal transduction histidine kinase